ncbi:Hypothetical_protein [Hexamita inflata]|uniref:Hypothetical_protein n=1 Tax=Hexamita inflata TaxID=28002 RepID=A0ABP1HNB6_9EUKA
MATWTEFNLEQIQSAPVHSVYSNTQILCSVTLCTLQCAVFAHTEASFSCDCPDLDEFNVDGQMLCLLKVQQDKQVSKSERQLLVLLTLLLYLNEVMELQNFQLMLQQIENRRLIPKLFQQNNTLQFYQFLQQNYNWVIFNFYHSLVQL